MSKFAKAILLKVTGDISTIKCNRSINLEVPQLKHFMGIKNKGKGEICQIGSWEDIDLDGSIFYIYGWLKGTNLEKNGIVLPYPYDDLELYNDIVIIKTDITNNLNNLTEAEYETFYKEISGIIESDDELDDFGLDDAIDNDDDDIEGDMEEEPEKSVYSSDSEDEEDDKKIDNIINDSDELVLTDEEL